jgi:integrator complex subunit 11
MTESTYGTTIRDSKRAREQDFLTKVHQCLERGGKVLIPVFALGRAQELCILIDQYWERMGLTVPIYFSAGMTQKANHYYRLYTHWTNQKLKKSFSGRNMFDFKHIKPWDMALLDNSGPQVLFASPGMLHAGTSLAVFRRWAPDVNNMVILPGYCVPGTVGARVLAGERDVSLCLDIVTHIC